jgi:S1-C subfamily serine protease
MNLAFAIAVSLSPLQLQANVADAIVKVYTTSQPYDYDAPWQAAAIEEATGSGVIIAGNRILTNAHVVGDATFIEVERQGTAERLIANVIAVSHQADLALLTADDPDFYSGVNPLEIGSLPNLLDDVLLYGFPDGGDGLSITKGVVSRIEVMSYAHSWMELLGLQIDAAVNSGNSGGPAIFEDKIIGIAMQGRKDLENTGYLIPTPVIRQFLSDFDDGEVDGVPALGVRVQRLDNPELIKSFGLPENMTGALVINVIPGSPADGHVQSGDVLLHIENFKVANDASVELRAGLRVAISYPTTRMQLNQNVQVNVWRDKQEKLVSFPLTERLGDSRLVLPPQYDRKPEYVIIAGIVFTPLSYNYLYTWGDEPDDAPPNLLKYINEIPQETDEQVVLVNGFLNSFMTVGYPEIATDNRVVRVNDTGVRNFRQFVELVDLSLEKGEQTVFGMEDGSILIISSSDHEKYEKGLLEVYSVPIARYLWD